MPHLDETSSDSSSLFLLNRLQKGASNMRMPHILSELSSSETNESKEHVLRQPDKTEQPSFLVSHVKMGDKSSECLKMCQIDVANNNEEKVVIDTERDLELDILLNETVEADAGATPQLAIDLFDGISNEVMLINNTVNNLELMDIDLLLSTDVLQNDASIIPKMEYETAYMDTEKSAVQILLEHAHLSQEESNTDNPECADAISLYEKNWDILEHQYWNDELLPPLQNSVPHAVPYNPQTQMNEGECMPSRDEELLGQEYHGANKLSDKSTGILYDLLKSEAWSKLLPLPQNPVHLQYTQEAHVDEYTNNEVLEQKNNDSTKGISNELLVRDACDTSNNELQNLVTVVVDNNEDMSSSNKLLKQESDDTTKIFNDFLTRETSDASNYNLQYLVSPTLQYNPKAEVDETRSLPPLRELLQKKKYATTKFFDAGTGMSYSLLVHEGCNASNYELENFVPALVQYNPKAEVEDDSSKIVTYDLLSHETYLQNLVSTDMYEQTDMSPCGEDWKQDSHDTSKLYEKCRNMSYNLLVRDTCDASNCDPQNSVLCSEAHVEEVSIDERHMQQIDASTLPPTGTCTELLRITDTKHEIKANTNDSGEQLLCEECGKVFMSERELNLHKRCVHKSRIDDLVCRTCAQVFSSEASLNFHLKEHPLECLVCGKLFYRVLSFRMHLKCHQDERPHTCDLCNKRFLTKQKLTEHRNIHTGNEPFTCNICQATFRRHSNLVAHKRRTHQKKVKDYVCACGETFHSKNKLNWHKEIHEPKPKSCRYCQEKFVHKASLTRHIRRAHNQRYVPEERNDTENVECEVCHGIYFKSSLAGHMAIHSGLKVHECNVCGKGFSTKWNMKLHRKTHVSGPKREFRCDECPRAFVRFSDLAAHSNSHKSVRPYTCNYCGDKFIRKPNCLRHEREHEESKSFTCPICSKTFHRSYYLKEHLRVHGGVRPFTCNICGKTISTKSNLNKHLKRHEAREQGPTEN